MRRVRLGVRKRCGGKRWNDNLQARRACLSAALAAATLVAASTADAKARLAPTTDPTSPPSSGSGVEVELPPLPTPDAESAESPDEAATSADPSETVGDGTSDAAQNDNSETALPFDEIDPAEIEAQLGASDKAPSRVYGPPVMKPRGVNDPFPDKVERIRPRDPAILLGVGVGLAAASAVMARLTLIPTCRNEDDASTCAVPSSGDIGVRGGRMVGTIAFGIGGAAFGAMGGRELGRWLNQDAGSKIGSRRNLAVGLGSASLVLGMAGTVAGSVLFGLGVRRSVAMAQSFDTVAAEPTGNELALVDETLGEIKTARTGLMLLGASPTFVAGGISLLVHRPRPRRLSISPQIDGRMVGASASFRF